MSSENKLWHGWPRIERFIALFCAIKALKGSELFYSVEAPFRSIQPIQPIFICHLFVGRFEVFWNKTCNMLQLLDLERTQRIAPGVESTTGSLIIVRTSAILRRLGSLSRCRSLILSTGLTVGIRLGLWVEKICTFRSVSAPSYYVSVCK